MARPRGVAIADDGAAGLIAPGNSMLDLVIADSFMPQMRGFESIRIFYDWAPTMPPIAISGELQKHIRLKRSAWGYVANPASRGFKQMGTFTCSTNQRRPNR